MHNVVSIDIVVEFDLVFVSGVVTKTESAMVKASISE